MSYELKKSQDAESDVMHVALIHRKVNDGRLQKPVSFCIQWTDDNSVTVSPEALEDVPEFVSELPLREQVIQAIRNNGPMTIRQIAEETGEKPGSLSVIVSRNRQIFTKAGNDRWEVYPEYRR